MSERTPEQQALFEQGRKDRIAGIKDLDLYSDFEKGLPYREGYRSMRDPECMTDAEMQANGIDPSALPVPPPLPRALEEPEASKGPETAPQVGKPQECPKAKPGTPKEPQLELF